MANSTRNAKINLAMNLYLMGKPHDEIAQRTGMSKAWVASVSSKYDFKAKKEVYEKATEDSIGTVTETISQLSFEIQAGGITPRRLGQLTKAVAQFEKYLRLAGSAPAGNPKEKPSSIQIKIGKVQ